VAAEVPFEARAYEALLSTVHELEGQRYHRLHAQLRHVLAYFRRGQRIFARIMGGCTAIGLLS
jgi:IS1 family transposase